ncbi:MAG: AI-2E family transporter [Phenylobacterium sp.]|uniref:AI-2E family transporter n=1 Tax=Phenylobacterium sp. TaxID=1871053 RepID=UPI00391DE893
MADRSATFGPDFVKRVAFVFALAAALLVAWQIVDVFLLAFGAVIVAVVLRSVADPIRDRTPLNDVASLFVATLAILGCLGGAGWLFGSTIADQVGELSDRMPRSREELATLVSRLPFGQALADEIGRADAVASRIEGFAGRLGGWAMTLIGAAANLLIVFVAGGYLALRPRAARDGLLLLFPKGMTQPLREALDASGAALRLWLLGTFADMAVVGVLTGLGTALLGLPSPVALGLFAAIVSFVPIVGPIVSAVPAVILALQQGPEMVLWTIGVYFLVQQIESILFYPIIQRKAVNLPPILTLFAVLTFGLLFGPLGVLFATPLLVVGLVLTKMLYVRNTLGKSVTLPGAPRGTSE